MRLRVDVLRLEREELGDELVSGLDNVVRVALRGRGEQLDAGGAQTRDLAEITGDVGTQPVAEGVVSDLRNRDKSAFQICPNQHARAYSHGVRKAVPTWDCSLLYPDIVSGDGKRR